MRPSLLRPPPKEIAAERFFVRADGEGGEGGSPVIAFLGGSLGASPINAAVQRILPGLLATHPAVRVLWQTGAAWASRASQPRNPHPSATRNLSAGAIAREAGEAGRLVVRSFFEDMAAVYAASDLIVARAGALTCAEVAALAQPAILVPSPHVAERHQHANAEAARARGGALVLEEAALEGEGLYESIRGLLSDNARGMHALRAAALEARAGDGKVDRGRGRRKDGTVCEDAATGIIVDYLCSEHL